MGSCPLAITSLSLEYSEALVKANTVTLNIPVRTPALHVTGSFPR